MTDETFDRGSWDRRWAQALSESPEKLASRPPNAHLLAEVADLPLGLALEAGCGHGSEAIWLATSGWRVTAVDFSTTALDDGRATAHAVGPHVADRIEWVEGDLGSWTQIVVAEERPRAAVGTGVDAMVRAERRQDSR